MKLNNKGFAVSTIMYMILILAVILIAASLSVLSARKLILDNLKKEVITNIHSDNPLVINGTLTLPTVLTFSESTVTKQIAIENYTGTRYDELIVKNSYGIDMKKITVNYPYIDLTELDISNCDAMENCTVTIGIPGTDVEDTMIIYYEYDGPTYILRFDTSEDIIPIDLTMTLDDPYALPIYYSGPTITEENVFVSYSCGPSIELGYDPKVYDENEHYLQMFSTNTPALYITFKAKSNQYYPGPLFYCKYDIGINGVVYDSRTFGIRIRN